MPEIPQKFDPDYLLARLQVAGLRDIYTEGESDARLLQDHFDETGLQVDVFPAVLLDVSDEIRSKYCCMEGGHKTKLLAMARHLTQVAGTDLRVRFVVDADLDRALGVLPSEPYVVVSDYTDIGVIPLTIAFIIRLITRNTTARRTTASTTADAVTEIACHCFAMRLAAFQLTGRAPRFDPADYLTLSGTTVTFDVGNAHRVFLQLSGLTARAAEFNARLEDWEASLALELDSRNRYQSHPIYQLLSKYLHRRVNANPAFDNEFSLRTLFFAMLGPDDLESLPTIKVLRSVLS